MGGLESRVKGCQEGVLQERVGNAGRGGRKGDEDQARGLSTTRLRLTSVDGALGAGESRPAGAGVASGAAVAWLSSPELEVGEPDDGESPDAWGLAASPPDPPDPPLEAIAVGRRTETIVPTGSRMGANEVTGFTSELTSVLTAGTGRAVARQRGERMREDETRTEGDAAWDGGGQEVDNRLQEASDGLGRHDDGLAGRERVSLM